MAVLDRGQYAYLVSRVALQHRDGDHWTLFRALGEALPALEALEATMTQRGHDFGELVRERRRQRGLPVPIADKVLPFRSASCSEMGVVELPEAAPAELSSSNAEAAARLRLKLAEVRMMEAWLQLDQSELQGSSQRKLSGLEAVYLHESRTYKAARTMLEQRPIPAPS